MRDQLQFFKKNMTPLRGEVFPLWDGISNFINSLLRRCWYVMIYNQETSKKAFEDIPELRTYNSNVTLWHSLRTNWTHHSYHFYRCSYVFKIPGKYHGGWCSLSTESDSRKLESTVRLLVADREKWKPFLVVELVGQYIRKLTWARKDAHDVERKWML